MVDVHGLRGFVPSPTCVLARKQTSLVNLGNSLNLSELQTLTSPKCYVGKIVIGLPQSRHAVSVNFNLPPGQTYFRTHLSLFPLMSVYVRSGEGGTTLLVTDLKKEREGFQGPFIVQALESP